MSRPISQLALICLLSAFSSAALSGQAPDGPRRLVLRLDGGSLNPDDPFTVTLAYGGQVGWQLSDRSIVLLGVMRQQLSLDIAGYPRDDARTYVLAGFERYLGWEEVKRQRYGVRLAAGVALREPLKAAPFFSAGVTIRYPLSPRFAFVGRLEDALAFLPTDSVTSCPAGPPCTTYRTGGKTQHNFGIFISAELRP